MKTKQSTIFIGASLAVLAFIFGLWFHHNQTPKLDKLESVIILPKPKALSDIQLINHHNHPFTLESLKGKWSILFFGFTNCPDVCPTTMQTLKKIKQTLSEQNAWKNYQVIMVSVDPKRDTVEKLSKYVPYFDSEFIGVTGDKTEIEKFSKELGIVFFSEENKQSDNYNVDHSASLILTNPNAHYAGAIPAPHNAEKISRDLIKISKQQKTSTTQKQDINIDNAWVRAAPPEANTMVAYFDIHNNSAQSVSITGIDSPQFSNAMIHNTQVKNGIATMTHMSQLALPANSTVNLKPQGLHAMLMKPKKPLQLGESIHLTLSFNNGQTLTKTIEIKEAP